MKSVLHLRRLSRLGLALLFSISGAHAAIVNVSTSANQFQPGVDNQGWWQQIHPLVGAGAKNDNYSTGRIGTGLSGIPYRSYFFFDFSGVTGTVTSASFEVARYTSTTGARLGLYDVTSPITDLVLNRVRDQPTGIVPAATKTAVYNDLGTGDLYADFTIPNTTAVPATENFLIPLTTAALADMNSFITNFNVNSPNTRYFAIGAAVINLPTNFNQTVPVFQSSSSEPGLTNGGSNRVQRLVLTVESPRQVPEPASLALLGVGLAALAALRGRR